MKKAVLLTILVLGIAFLAWVKGLSKEIYLLALGSLLGASAVRYAQSQGICLPGQSITEKTGGPIKRGKIVYNKSFILGKGRSTVYSGMYENRIPVAVKKISNLDIKLSDLSSELSNIQLMLGREIKINQAHTEWGCPNVVRYYGFESYKEPSGQISILLALEQCQHTLDEFTRGRDHFPSLLNSNIFYQMTNGLNHLHMNKIVHRDLKPSNVLIKTGRKGNDFIFKLADFGLAKMLPGDTSASPLSYTCGTEGWLAPEILNEQSRRSKEPLSFRRSDIYTLGLIFFFVASKGKMRTDVTQNDYKLIGNDYTLFTLLIEMTYKMPKNRLKVDKVLKHPALWSPEYTLEFLSTVSDHFQRKNALCLEDPDIIGNDWSKQLPKSVHDYLFIHARQVHAVHYDKSKVQSLLRAIRNCNRHFNGLPAELGTKRSEMLFFWTGCFEKLLIHTYRKCESLCHSSDLLDKFYN